MTKSENMQTAANAMTIDTEKQKGNHTVSENENDSAGCSSDIDSDGIGYEQYKSTRDHVTTKIFYSDNNEESIMEYQNSDLESVTSADEYLRDRVEILYDEFPEMLPMRRE